MRKTTVYILNSIITFTLLIIFPAAYSGQDPRHFDNAEANMNNAISSSLLIEVRRGGGMEAPPHPIVIRIYVDGRTEYHDVVLTKEPLEISQLMERIKASGLFLVTQNELDKQLMEAGELNVSLRGGTGVYTIAVNVDGVVYTLRLNRPELYERSAVEPARLFYKVYEWIEEFASS